MYNSTLKYYAKSILGRRNDMWYFDKLERSYSIKQQKLVKECIQLSDQAIRSSVPELKTSSARLNPLYDKGKNLRDDCIEEYKDKFGNSQCELFVHLPPISVSVAGNSLFLNVGESFRHLGIQVNYFWDNFADLKFNKETSIILTCFDDVYRSKIDWELISTLQKKNRIIIGSSLPPGETVEEIKHSIDAWLENDHCFFFTYLTDSFVNGPEFEIGAYIKSLGKKIHSLEFGANPLIHFPNKYLNHVSDYIFLGSANHDKIQRYYQYFFRLFKNQKGLVAGPGWHWTPNFEIKSKRDRFLYSFAKIGINLHIDLQFKFPCELNERTYILASCGVPQLVDHPKLIDSHFPSVGYIADNPDQYHQMILDIENNYDEALGKAEKAMENVISRYTTFKRIEMFVASFKKELKLDF